MKTFIKPEIEISDLSPSQTVMDDITISKNQDTGIDPVGENELYIDWKNKFYNDEAIW